MTTIKDITVNWAEGDSRCSRAAGKTMPLADFEAMARQDARDVGTRGGYQKTNVTLNLDNGDHVTFRCDLAEDDDHGALDVVRSYQRWLTENPEELDSIWGADFYAAIMNIQLPN